ncbi:MAG: protein serine/threonine phosphatase [Bacteroidetes bacterium]|jgi:serine phosphatase RsbU (regulator of sigma subunit)|nr:protein serine/threonine phosphatase [Bacteroidota bacterium]
MCNSPKIHLLVFFFFLAGFSFSQINIDSLVKEFDALPNDTVSIGKITRYANFQKKINNDVGLAAFQVALKKSRAINDPDKTVQSLLFVGNAYLIKSDFPNASLHLNEAERMAMSLNDTKMLLRIKMTIGNMYSYSHQTSKAKEIYFEVLNLCGNKPSTTRATVLNNIGGILYREAAMRPDKIAEAGRYVLNAVKTLEEIGSDHDIISKYNNLGLIYGDIQKYDSALLFLNKAKVLIDKENLPDDLINYYMYMGRIYMDQRKFEEAEKVYFRALEESNKLRLPEWVAESYISLADLYDAKGDYKTSLDYFRKYHALSDSLVNATNFKTAADIQNKFEREKKETELTKLKAEQAKNRIFNIALIAISVLLVISGGMMYSRFKIKAESEKKLKSQNEIISQKNKDITDSINYSRKIQDAILPSEKNILELFPQSFVYYKPKDIISGDFYWCAKVGSLKYFAVADCTGHGVPGALMSMLGTSLLKEIILTRNITKTNEILNELRKLVINALDQNSGSKDGMDIALICYDEKNKELHFSGANNAAIIVSNNNLNELKPDKQPIGSYEKTEDFTSKTISVEPGTLVYMYTDGYADQFGGPKGKKFKYKQLDDLLIANNNSSLQLQKEILHKALSDWKGTLEQVDDVCVVGIRLM